MADSGDETEWELAAEKFVATVAPKETTPSRGRPSSRATRSPLREAPPEAAPNAGAGTAGRPGRSAGSSGPSEPTADTTTGTTRVARGAQPKPAGKPSGVGGNRGSDVAAAPSQVIQVLRFSSDASLTATVRGSQANQQALWDRARSAFESALRRNATRLELDALAAALQTVGVDISLGRNAGTRGGGPATNGPTDGSGGRRSGAAAGGTASRTPQPALTRGRNAWTPSFLTKTADTSATEGENLVNSSRRKAKAILNKLVPEKFVTLAQQILDMPLHHYDVLEAVISEIFDKALAEPYFCGVYADLCEVLNRALPSIAIESASGTKQTNFRKMLLARCQAEFVQRALASEERATDEQELEVCAHNRRRTLGNTIFVGELFKRHLLSEKIIHECVQMLLKEGENEDSIETLAKLLSVAGSSMDRPEARSYMDAYFTKIEEMANNAQIRARYRFMLKDCVELRKQKWKPRRAQERPATLDEIHGKKSGRAARQASQSLARKAAQLRFTGADAEAPKPEAESTVPAGQVSASATVQGRVENARNQNVAGETVTDAAHAKSESGPVPDRTVVWTENPELLRTYIRGIIEDYVVNPYPAEVQVALTESGLAAQPDLLALAGVQELFSMVCSARGHERQPLVRSFGDAFQHVLSREKLLEALVSITSNLLTFEDELDMPTAGKVLGEFLGTLCTSHCATFLHDAADIHTVLAAVPPNRQASVLRSFLETLFRQYPSDMRERFGASLRALRPLFVSLPQTEQRELEELLAKYELLELVPEWQLRRQLQYYLEPGKERIADAADWLRSFLPRVRETLRSEDATASTAKSSLNEWYAFCRFTADHILSTYVMEAQSSSTMDIMRRLRLMVPLLRETAGNMPATDETDDDDDSDPAEDKEWRQAQVAFAVQAGCYRLDFPTDLISGMFQVLYDADVISEEAFDRWREDVHDTTPGKLKALFHVNAFLNWLKETDEEPEKSNV